MILSLHYLFLSRGSYGTPGCFQRRPLSVLYASRSLVLNIPVEFGQCWKGCYCLWIRHDSIKQRASGSSSFPLNTSVASDQVYLLKLIRSVLPYRDPFVFHLVVCSFPLPKRPLGRSIWQNMVLQNPCSCCIFASFATSCINEFKNFLPCSCFLYWIISFIHLLSKARFSSDIICLTEIGTLFFGRLPYPAFCREIRYFWCVERIMYFASNMCV